jgi:hypothetical protein
VVGIGAAEAAAAEAAVPDGGRFGTGTPPRMEYPLPLRGEAEWMGEAGGSSADDGADGCIAPGGLLDAA